MTSPPAEPRAWWHGCWLTSGHYLFDRDGHWPARGACPLEGNTFLDEGLAPRLLRQGARSPVPPLPGDIVGRVHFFVIQLRRGIQVDPIDVGTEVLPRSGSPSWGLPYIDDGHHRFAAAVIAGCPTIPMQFSGLLSTRDWLVGLTRRPPPEVSEMLRA